MELSQITFDFIEPVPEKEEDKKTKHKKYSQKREMDTKVKSPRGRKSLKSFDDNADFLEIPPDDILFEKSYYPIGDVAEQRTADDPSDRHHERIRSGIGHGHVLAVVKKVVR